MKKITILSIIVLGLFACSNNKQEDQKFNKHTITVSVLPQKYFAEKILGDQYNINVMIPPGASPVTYEPSPRQMKELSASTTYIRIGHIEFEKAWMSKFQNLNPEMDIIDISINAELIESEYNHKTDHNGHHHHGVDPHIWTSPKEVKKQIELIYQYFVKKYPDSKPEFTNNYRNFANEIDSLDSYIEETLQAFQGRKFLIFHPALSYIARDYSLEQVSIEIDGKEPTPANIQEIIEVAKKEDIKVVFVQKQFSTHNAVVIANEISGRVVQIDPLSYSWNESIKMIIDEIVKSY
ncbi:MAG: zinc ABC transporter substrate-binding protein [Bacteroidales bacterium]|nr:zinc ABC transporter substrate-binding protein [Bacteroidales bacterium]